MNKSSKIFLKNSSTKKNKFQSDQKTIYIYIKKQQQKGIKIPLKIQKIYNEQDFNLLQQKQEFEYLKNTKFNSLKYQQNVVATFQFNNKCIKYQDISSFYYNLFSNCFILKNKNLKEYFFIPSDKQFLVLQFCKVTRKKDKIKPRSKSAILTSYKEQPSTQVIRVKFTKQKKLNKNLIEMRFFRMLNKALEIGLENIELDKELKVTKP